MSGEVDPRLKIGILGGGQLGRMLALAGYPLGFAFRVLDPTSRVSASKVSDHICAKYDDPAALHQLVAWSDVITYEFENVPEDALERIERDVEVFPPRRALEVTSDRLDEKHFFERLDIDTAEFEPVASAADLEDAVEQLGLPLVVKSRRLGYDGKGQARVERRDQIEAAWEQVDRRPSIAERHVDFDRELSVLGTRSHDGRIQTFPLVENIHRDGILVESRAPAPRAGPTTVEAARSACRRLLRELDYVGTLALELFDTGDGLMANEFAPRVHNSGHWTIEGAAVSQFENHVRAVAGQPLGQPEPAGHVRMINIIGAWPDRTALLELEQTHLHDYEKEPRPGRKIGHVTVRTDDADRADRLAAEVRSIVEPARDLG